VKTYSRIFLFGVIVNLVVVFATGLHNYLSPIVSLALLGVFPLFVRREPGFIHSRYRWSKSRHNPEAKVFANSNSRLSSLQWEIGTQCTECGACRKTCTFLKQYGTPKGIAAFDFSSAQKQSIAYECSLCGLCTAVCPEKLDPARLFLEVRRRCVAGGNLDTSIYRKILAYETLGRSSLFSWYGLPQGCDTIFFPGCALPGTRPGVTKAIYRQLQEMIPTIGLVLACCSKPSHDLGRAEYFEGIFNSMNNYFAAKGITTVLTACPSCTKIFRQYGHGLDVRTVYEFIHTNGKGGNKRKEGKPNAHFAAEKAITVHDPCPLRDDLPTQQAVRKVLTDMGHTLVEMENHGNHTLCCGEGGMVGAINPERAADWAVLCGQESGGRQIVTYCAGCTGYLNRVAPAVHIADLLFRPEVALMGNLKIARAPLTYWNRLRFKHCMKSDGNPG
jgi:Fe-S oxidoreductase